MPASRLYKFPLDLDSATGEYPHRITFQAMEGGFGRQNGAPGDMVALYLPPDALKAAYTQSYGGADMGSLGIALAGVDRGQAQDVVGQMMAGSGAGTTAALKSLKDATGKNILGSLVAAGTKEAIGKMGGPAGTAVTALAKKVGVIMNPHKAMIYQGPGGFRTFSYTFTMSPQSKAESTAVKNIVAFFKYYMHPGVAGLSPPGPPGQPRTITTGGNIDTSSALTYPEEFEIKMLVNRAASRESTAKPLPPLFNIGRCVLESFSVDYATAGGPAFFAADGEPVTTTISLGFKETILMTKVTINKGF